ncbi:phosphopantetheine-binding protein [Desulfosarcina sp. OttesenSCG-928-A07]|nr:phosphopantetheine-binding protein [Desulfosarcina sp. OttesenSCG-928-A07]
MTRDDITRNLLAIFAKQFEIENPGMDEDLREAYEFDSIDAIELLREIELMLGDPLTRDEKESAMTIRTFGQIVDYVEGLAKTRAQLGDAR